MLKNFSEKYGTTILVVLHDLTLADAFCEEVVILKSGKLVKSGPPKNVITTKILRSVFQADVQLHRGPDGAASLNFRLDILD